VGGAAAAVAGHAYAGGVELGESRRTSWSRLDAALVYERGRPGYPEPMVDWALAPVRDRPGLRALDLGAGTGKLTAQLVARGVDTVAVEPAEGMRRRLARGVRAATVLAGSAERVPLPDASVDLVTVAQAFHWFDPAPALAEIARVLRPAGVLAIFYNSRDDAVAWVRALSDIVGEVEDHASLRPRKDPELGPAFGPVEVSEMPHEQELDAAGLVDLVGSRSYVIRMEPAERAALLDRVVRLTREHPGLVGRQHFSMPYLTRVYRASTLRS
jgi:SAM-dependent methyltransferase